MPDLLPRVQITAANRRFHFSLMAEWRFSRGVQEQTEAFLGGFNEVVPLQWLQYFDEKELEVRPLPRAGGGASGGGGGRPEPCHPSTRPAGRGPLGHGDGVAQGHESVNAAPLLILRIL